MTHHRRNVKLNCVFAFVLILVVSHGLGQIDAKRVITSNRKTSSGSGQSTRRQPSTSNGGSQVTKPSYSSNAGGGDNSHADIAKLSYSNYNSQPNRPGTNANSQPIGWNVPKQQGPPPAYSASNPVGGAKSNVYEAPPAYKPNNAPPPSYGASYPQQPAGATYHAPGSLPAGATYYPSAGHVPASGYYPSGGHYPAAGGYGGGYGGAPPGATFLPAGAPLPMGATYYQQPPQQSSSGLGFGTGLIAGGLGGALLGHALTPTHTRVVEQAPTSGGSPGGGEDRVIIINNGPPGSVTTNAAGATVITTGGVPVNGTGAAESAPLAPMDTNLNAINATNLNAAVQTQQPTGATPAEQPPPGGIICVPMRVNETDPNDTAKMIEVEKIACYPAPPPPPQQQQQFSGNETAPLAPLNPAYGDNSQQLQQSTLLPGDASVRMSGANKMPKSILGIIFSSSTLLLLQLAYGMQ